MPRTSTAKTSMVASAALLLRERGIARTRFEDVIAHSDAPRGSIGHHFPEGKRQLVEEAVLWAGARATGALREAAERGTSADLVRLMVAIYRRALVDTDFAAGCPVGMVAQEGHQDDALRAAVGRVFDEWRTVLSQALTRDGHDAEAARTLASVLIASVEGALMVARIDRDPRPLDDVETVALDLVARPR